MKLLFEEFGNTALAIVVSIVTLGIFLSVLLVDVLPISVKEVEINVNEKAIDNNEIVKIKNFIVKDGVAELGNDFDYRDRVEAINSRDEDISNFISLSQPLDTSTIGEKDVTYVLRYNGEKRLGKAKVFVQEANNENNG